MNQLIWSTIASASIQLISGESIVSPSTPKVILVQVDQPIKIHSWQEKFEHKRQETEFLDDDTEKLLSRNKKWLILISIVFVWMIYKSLWSYK